MSGPGTPRASAQQPKQMSSRLLTMKFMQRAAAASSPNSTLTPRSAASTPASEPSSKRRKLDTSHQVSVPSTPNSDSFADQSAIAAALKAEAETQARARAKHAKEGDETEWVLNISVPQPQINGNSNSMPNGHAEYEEGEFDSEEDEGSEEDIWTTSTPGRQTYGEFSRKKTSMMHVEDTRDDEELSSASESEPDFQSTSPASLLLKKAISKQGKEKEARPPNQKAQSDRSQKSQYGSPLTNMSLKRLERADKKRNTSNFGSNSNGIGGHEWRRADSNSKTSRQ